MNKTYIYSLSCPLDGEVKYIGKSNDPTGRFRKHKNLGKLGNSEKDIWIKGLLDKNLQPILTIIEEVDITEWKMKEKHYIKLFEENGFNLYNILGGANGPTYGNSGSFKGNPPVQVVCLKKNGEYVKTFKSLKDGRLFCGKRIDGVLSGRKKTAGGYIWIYKKDYDNLSEEELESIIERANINNSNKNGMETRYKSGTPPWNKGKFGFISKKRKEVHQYSLEGEFIKTWSYAQEAASQFNCAPNNITMCASGRTKTACGYKWSYEINQNR